ncbi:MAG: nitrite reductase large subunit NirB [Myxococcales bacterium]|nr:nitrite reductase large subunit NirB [Myxococcales bacterium]
MDTAEHRNKGRVIVIGNGMVGHRFCERMVDLEANTRFEMTVIGAEVHPAYDRVRLSEFFSERGAEKLMLTTSAWYDEHDIRLRLGETVTSIDCAARMIYTSSSTSYPYDSLVLACGSRPWVIPVPGVELPGVFVYRTIDDLEQIAVWAKGASRAAIIGGGLLGLEAAKAALDLGLEAHIIEYADRLMPRQLDAPASSFLQDEITALGAKVHLGMRTEALVGDERVTGLRFTDQPSLDVDMVIISAGIRPMDELARGAGLTVAERGGVVVGDGLETSDPHIFAIGECAVHRSVHYGLVAPGYEMADVLAGRLTGQDGIFKGADLSAKLKLMGVEVASFGAYFADKDPSSGVRTLSFEDRTQGVYQKLLLSPDARQLLGGILVGDASSYTVLQELARSGNEVPENARELLFGKGGGGPALELPGTAQICSCHNVTKNDLVGAMAGGDVVTLSGLKSATKAGTGCGGCQPEVKRVFEAELARLGHEVNTHLCEHFAYSRQELYWIVKVQKLKSFNTLVEQYGEGDGCEICRPAVASILAATWNELVVEHSSIQDTNDRFLANIQRGGTYSVIPRVPGGEITPAKLIKLGEVAQKYDLYCKITGGQRIDLLGARVDQLPDIWEELVEAGFESGHAYGKAMRTVKSCVGSTWCRFGVQDSTAFAIRVEERYRGLRAPHKLKSAVSGCIRECAEAQNKDFGIIATENGWNLYVCGNGGSQPRHGDLLVTDADGDDVIRIIDRFLMFYIRTAKPLQRTARWLEELEGGLEQLKEVVLQDSLGICDQLEEDMQALVNTYACEWKAVVESPRLRARFKPFANSEPGDDMVYFIRERGQKQPAPWPDVAPPEHRKLTAKDSWTWYQLASVEDVTEDCGTTVSYEGIQLAIYNFAHRGEWFATQAMCPHRKEHILARGLLGDQAGEPKVICPLHKKAFSLEDGRCMNDPQYQVQVFPVEVRGQEVWVKLPKANELRESLGKVMATA